MQTGRMPPGVRRHGGTVRLAPGPILEFFTHRPYRRRRGTSGSKMGEEVAFPRSASSVRCGRAISSQY
jgi:hypothetical protein